MVLTFKRISFSFASAWHFKLQRYVWRLSLDLQKPSIMITFGSIKQKPCYVIWRKLFSHPFLFNSYIQPFLRTLLARLNTVPTEGQKICRAQKNRKHMEGKDVASGTVDIGGEGGEQLSPYKYPGSDGHTTYQHCWTTTTRIHFSSLEDGWLDIWLSLNKARYSAVSHVLTINLLSKIKNIHKLSLEKLFKLDQ